jgi:hypothetical protein
MNASISTNAASFPLVASHATASQTAHALSVRQLLRVRQTSNSALITAKNKPALKPSATASTVANASGHSITSLANTAAWSAR